MPWRAGVLALLLLLGTACSALRLAYEQGPSLSYWWLDRYLDLDGRQTPPVRAALDAAFARFRGAPLEAVAADLRELRAALPGEVDAATVCRWVERARLHRDAAMALVLPSAVELVPSLSMAQIEHMQARQHKLIEEERAQLLDADPEVRLEAAVKRMGKDFARLYGDLEAPQRDVLVRWQREAPYTAQTLIDARQARQQALVQTLRALQVPGAARDAASVRKSLQAWWDEHWARPTAGSARAQQLAYGCRMGAALHASTSPAQRREAVERVEAWLQDIETLRRGAPAAAGVAASASATP